VSNTVKYTPSGGDVRVRTYTTEDTAAVEVTDTGIGMDPDSVPELFEPFRQASEGMGREYESTGLGLTVAQRAVNRMGGSIEVETEPDEGTRVTVHLPPAE
jgi:signal transduction histidine kinase